VSVLIPNTSAVVQPKDAAAAIVPQLLTAINNKILYMAEKYMN